MVEDKMLQRLARREKDQSLIRRSRLLPTENGNQSKIIDVPTGRRLGLLGWSFVLCVILPALIASGYFALIESDEYVSEAHFTIRKAAQSESPISNAISSVSASMGMGGGNSLTTQDVFIVADYIRSRTIIQDIGGRSLLFQAYARPDIDWLSRLSSSAPLEKVWKYWKKKVRADIDTPSGIITLDVRSFTREDAQHLAQAILKSSEALVNDISERSRRDALIRAQSEVKRAEDRLRKARADLLVFRNKSKLIDPMLNATSIGDSISKLMQDRLSLESNRAALGKSVSSDAPTLRVLNGQIATINQQIADLQDQLTSQTKSDTISSQLGGYESRQLEVQFAEGLYSAAKDSYEAARREQDKQQLYLVTIDKPSMPEKPTYPRVFVDTFTVFAACLVLWSMVVLLVASVRDHMGN
jgi:capsular polysaccharide transport system permease protein